MNVLRVLFLIFCSAIFVCAQDTDQKKLNSRDDIKDAKIWYEIKPNLIEHSKIEKEKTGFVRGLTTDEIGAAIPFLTINFTDETGKSVQTKSDDKGEYEIKLAPGIYTIATEEKINSILLKLKETKIEIKNSDRKKQDLILYCADKNKCSTVTTYYCG